MPAATVVADASSNSAAFTNEDVSTVTAVINCSHAKLKEYLVDSDYAVKSLLGASHVRALNGADYQTLRHGQDIEVLSRRWIVEQTFALLIRCRIADQ
jgi:hypothetical protein